MSSRARVKADPKAWLRLCNDMLEETDFEFAWETIEGIRDWIEENDLVTGKQINALQNIRRATL